MKTGCNFQDQNNIRRYVENGETDPILIGKCLNIDPKVVEEFVDIFIGQIGEAADAAA